MLTIAIASDHRGVELKTELISFILEMGHKVNNLGTDDSSPVDYPEYGYLVANEISSNRADFGVVICGTGIGISIAANRNKYARAALCSNKEFASISRKHNNANILALGAGFIDKETAKDCLTTFLITTFEGGRHQERVKKLFKNEP